MFYGLDGPDVSFGFPVRLGMVGHGEDVVYVQDFSNFLKELGVEVSSVVVDELLRSSVVGNPFIHEVLDHLYFC